MEGKFLISPKLNFFLHSILLLVIRGSSFKHDHTLITVRFYNNGIYDFCVIIDDLSIFLALVLIYRRHPMAQTCLCMPLPRPVNNHDLLEIAEGKQRTLLD